MWAKWRSLKNMIIYFLLFSQKPWLKNNIVQRYLTCPASKEYLGLLYQKWGRERERRNLPSRRHLGEIIICSSLPVFWWFNSKILLSGSTFFFGNGLEQEPSGSHAASWPTVCFFHFSGQKVGWGKGYFFYEGSHPLLWCVVLSWVCIQI